MLGESKLYVLYQDAKGNLGKPVTLPLAGAVKAFQVVDLAMATGAVIWR